MKFTGILKSWLPVLLWMVLMFAASTDLLSSEHTSRYLVPFLRWLKPDISAAAIAEIHFLIRKCAHLTEYAILAVLLWRAFRFDRSIALLRIWPEAIIALLVAFIFAATDEYHQSQVTSRGASGRDVMIDGCGAALGLTLRWRFGYRRRMESTNDNANRGHENSAGI